jgi:hypothetical protein
MAIRHAKALTWRPRGLSDAVDGSNVPHGAMALLSNLIPDAATADVWVCRPASVSKTTFGSYTTPGFISGLLIVGDIAYGLIASGRNANKDEPFAYNIATNTFLTVSGITNANSPTSPATSGDWTPPILCQVGGRIVVTHPGFAGGTVKFGWFDVSGFSLSPVGNTNTSTLITGNPGILGIQPGMTITGTNIPASTTIVSTASFALNTTGNTHTTTQLNGIPSTAGVAVGQTVTGNGIPSGTTVAVVVSAVEVTLSQAATSTLAGVAVFFGGATITLSAAATGSTNSSTFTVLGGTTAAPQWGAGDTNLNNLPSVPLGVAQMGGRAFFACGTNGIPFSDSGLACQISNNPNVQILLPSNGISVTAIGPLQLSSLTGGIVQSLIAFQGAAQMQQITGDPTTLNLLMNALPVATGTLAPLSITPCSQGLSFVSPQGMRIIDFTARVSDPVGDAGKGVVLPFAFASNPSRICSAANGDVVRVSVINGRLSVTQTQEYWYHFARKVWSGPHTFPASLICAWQATFVLSASGINAKLWQSDAYTSVSSTYTENSTALSWDWQTVLLPDNASGEMNSMVEATIAMALGASQTAIVIAMDENGTVLNQVTIAGGGSAAVWGTSVWGAFTWGGQGSAYQQRSIDWTEPVLFKQVAIQANGFSD